MFNDNIFLISHSLLYRELQLRKPRKITNWRYDSVNMTGKEKQFDFQTFKVKGKNFKQVEIIRNPFSKTLDTIEEQVDKTISLTTTSPIFNKNKITANFLNSYKKKGNFKVSYFNYTVD